MAEPILERMTPEERAKYEALRASGYSALAASHEIYMAAANRPKGESHG